MRRFFELKMPRETEPPRPNGFPSATTVSPSSRSSSGANLTALNFSPGFVLSLSSAMSLPGDATYCGSTSNTRPSASFTCASSARRTTCRHVST